MRRRLLLLFCLCGFGAGILPARESGPILVRRDRTFQASYDRVWEVVVAEIRRIGWEIRRAEKGKGILQTSFYEFAPGTFGPNVATRPPPLTWEYGYYHMVILDHGRSRLRVSVRPAKEGTRVSIHADVEEYTFHRDLREMVWGRRESNGAIEIHLLDRIEENLESKAGEPAAGNSK